MGQTRKFPHNGSLPIAMFVNEEGQSMIEIQHMNLVALTSIRSR